MKHSPYALKPGETPDNKPMCTAPKLHRDVWRSIFGPHWICSTCKPPGNEKIVAERSTRERVGI